MTNWLQGKGIILIMVINQENRFIIYSDSNRVGVIPSEGDEILFSMDTKGLSPEEWENMASILRAAAASVHQIDINTLPTVDDLLEAAR